LSRSVIAMQRMISVVSLVVVVSSLWSIWSFADVACLWE
jgi:hypothetical protein